MTAATALGKATVTAFGNVRHHTHMTPGQNAGIVLLSLGHEQPGIMSAAEASHSSNIEYGGIRWDHIELYRLVLESQASIFKFKTECSSRDRS